MCYKSAPKLGNSPKDGQLRKTQSGPQPSCMPGQQQPPSIIEHPSKARFQADAHKHIRCRLVPSPLLEEGGPKPIQGIGAKLRELSCPSSPTECAKNNLREKQEETDKSCSAADLSNSSPSESSSSSLNSSDTTKPKKTVFEGGRNIGMRKSKNDNCATSKTDLSYANSVESSLEIETRTSSHGNATPPREGATNNGESTSTREYTYIYI